MLLTDARRLARTRPDGALVPLAEPRRTLSIPEQRYLESRAAQLAPLARS